MTTDSPATHSGPDAVRPVEILLVEDNPGDVLLTREALREARVANNLFVVSDGEAALEFLRQTGDHAGAVRPDVVLLDLNLPKLTGLEVLAEVKDDPDLQSIPIIMLTTSDSDTDVIRAYSSHVNAYVTKPINMTVFLDVIRSFEAFWLQVVRLPNS